MGKMRTDVRRNGESCSCSECVPGSKWFLASQNLSSWRQSSTCGKIPHLDLENPADGVTPHFCRLQCSLLPKEKSAKRKRERKEHLTFCCLTTIPHHMLVKLANYVVGQTLLPVTALSRWVTNRASGWRSKKNLVHEVRASMIGNLEHEKSLLISFEKRDRGIITISGSISGQGISMPLTIKYLMGGLRYQSQPTLVLLTTWNSKRQKSAHMGHRAMLVALVLHSPGIRDISSSGSGSCEQQWQWQWQ